MRLYGTLLFAALAPLMAGADPAPTPAPDAPRSVEDAVYDHTEDPAEPLLRIAALKSPVLLEQELRVAQADAFRFRGWRQYAPFLYANWQAGYFSLLGSNDPNAKEGTSQFGGSFTLGANYPIYAWGAIEAEKKFTFARENAAKNKAVLTWRALVKTIRLNLCDAAVCKATVALLEKRVERSKRDDSRTEQEFKLGRIVAIERAARLLESREVELNFNKEKIRLASLLTKLRSLTGADNYGSSEIPSDLPDIVWKDSVLDARLAEFKKSGLDGTPEATGARYEREMYREQRIMAEARELPVFNLGTNVTQQPQQTAGGFGMQTFLFAGITGSWNIFDRDTTKESIRAQILGERLVETQLKVTTKERLAEMDGAVQELKAARANRDLLNEVVSSRNDACESTRRLRDAGRATNDEVTASEIKLLDSRLTLIKERAEIIKAYHSFMSGMQLSPSDSFYSAPSNDR